MGQAGHGTRLPGASLPVALGRSEEWRAGFADAMTENAARTPVRCTVSIGLALLRPGREDFASAFRRADAALYEAKRTGRNRVVSAEPAP